MIELLAVVTILGVVASLGLTRLAAADRQAAINEALARVQDLDARARLLARTGSPALIDIEDDGSTWTLLSGDERIARVEFASSVNVQPHQQLRWLDRITYDRLGRSRDYEVRLQLEERLLTRTVCGLTGVFINDEAAP